MYGGSVKNNKTTQNGGGISVQPSSSGGVYLYDGEISGNSAVNGGGIYFDNGYNFNMSGGEIKIIVLLKVVQVYLYWAI